MHSKSHKIEFMIYDNADEVIEEHFELLFNRYRIGLETSIGISDLVLDCVHLLYQKYRKINLNQGGSYTDSPESIQNKKATINPINDDDKCFHYATTVEINHKEIERSSQGVPKIKLFINK